MCVLSKLQIRGGKTHQEGKTKGLENFQLKIRTKFPVPALGRLEGGWGLQGVRILEPVRPPHFFFFFFFNFTVLYWFCPGGILELRRGIQDASCVGPGKSNLPFELRRKAGDCSRVTPGPIDLI